MRNRKIYDVMLAKAATGIGNIIDVRDFRNVVVSVATSDNANCTILCKGSIGDDAAAFGSAASVANMWGTLELATLADSSAPVRGTGIALTGTDILKLYEININGIDFITFDVSVYVAGKVTIKLVVVDNA